MAESLSVGEQSPRTVEETIVTSRPAIPMESIREAVRGVMTEMFPALLTPSAQSTSEGISPGVKC